MNNKVYDTLKWVLFIVVPAILTLIDGLGVVFEFDTTKITSIISIVATFVGSITMISNSNYRKEIENDKDRN